MTKFLMPILWAIAAVSACSSPAPSTKAVSTGASGSATDVVPVIDAAIAEVFPGCKLVKVSSAGAAIWAFNCPETENSEHLIADASLPGIALLRQDGDGKKTPMPVIILFTKAKDAPVSTIADQVRKISPEIAGATCALTPLDSEVASSLFPSASQRYSWTPTGKAKQEWDARDSTLTEGDFVSPCGIYGPQEMGIVTFEALNGDSTKVAMISWGNELQIFLPQTLRADAR